MKGWWLFFYRKRKIKIAHGMYSSVFGLEKRFVFCEAAEIWLVARCFVISKDKAN